MPSDSCSILLYWASVLVKLLLVNTIGCSITLSGASFLQNSFYLSLTKDLFQNLLTIHPSLGTAVLLQYRMQWLHS